MAFLEKQETELALEVAPSSPVNGPEECGGQDQSCLSEPPIDVNFWAHPAEWRPAQCQREGDEQRQREEETMMVSWFTHSDGVLMTRLALF